MGFVFSNVLMPFIGWGQYCFYLAVILIVANKRFGWFKYFYRLSYKFLIGLVLGFKIIYASAETWAQYYVWSNNNLTKLLLDKSVINLDILRDFSGKFFILLNNRFGYFLFYSWGRFWFEIFVSLLAASVFYLFLLLLEKYKDRFFIEGETELGFLLSLMVGWSNFIVFLPLVFLSIVLVSVFKAVVLKEAYTTIGVPLIVAALIVLLLGNYLVNFLGLTQLRV